MNIKSRFKPSKWIIQGDIVNLNKVIKEMTEEDEEGNKSVLGYEVEHYKIPKEDRLFETVRNDVNGDPITPVLGENNEEIYPIYLDVFFEVEFAKAQEQI
ncbi:MAG TPA: hypothetical protein DCR90_05755 [Fusobacteriaceae bacterium]|nr:hypothetical protein [Fusobacteriaceae bacterium]